MSLVLDSATPMLQELVQVSAGYARDGLNYASLKLQKGMKQKAKSYNKSIFGSRFDKNNRRKLAGSQQKGIKGRYYSRFSKKDGSREKVQLDEFIKFQVSKVKLSSVVGFINIKGFKADLYKDGRKRGSTYVQGQKVKGIGLKMENGSIEKLTEKQKGFFRASGWGAVANKGYIVRKARPVVNPTFRAMQGSIDAIFKNKYSEALVKHSKKTNTKTRKID